MPAWLAASRALASAVSWALLRRSRGVWRLTHLVSGLANRRYPFSVLRIDPDGARAPQNPARGPQGGTPGRRLH